MHTGDEHLSVNTTVKLLINYGLPHSHILEITL